MIQQSRNAGAPASRGANAGITSRSEVPEFFFELTSAFLHRNPALTTVPSTLYKLPKAVAACRLFRVSTVRGGDISV